MILTYFNQLSNRIRVWFKQRQTRPIPLDRPALHHLAQDPDSLPLFVQQCPVAQKYLKLLGILDWDNLPSRDEQRPWSGVSPLPRGPFIAAYLVKLQEQKRYMSNLREYLVEHPALVWLLGFPLVPASDSPWGFDVAASVPAKRTLISILHDLDNQTIQALLTQTVELIRQDLPDDLDFGQTISLDTKHVIAWVKENNPKAYLKTGRYDKTNQPAADPDCKLGVKRRRNQHPNGPKKKGSPTPTTDPIPARFCRLIDMYWGYGSGVVATKIPGWAEIVLAELTQPFNESDISYFHPLLRMTEQRLGFRPPYAAFDAAFDAHYIYDYFHTVGGLAAVPYSGKGGPPRQFDDAGLPLCQAGLAMPVKHTFMRRTAFFPHQQARHACPLLYPQPSAKACPINHKRWPKGGCLTTLATSQGARIRHQLDRQGPLYKDIYRQRTATERINSQAKALGIERPKLRNQQSITNYNSLIYLLINLRAIQRLRKKLAHSASENQA